MISEADALAKILSQVRRLPERTVPLVEADRCFAAHDLFSALPLPMFDNSSMDGYAVLASDCIVGQRLRVIGEQPAGVDQRLSVTEGVAVRILTGAPVPVGADAVIMQEDVEADRDEIVIGCAVELGENVRRKGCDLAEGQKIVSAGERFTPQIIALLASQGMAQVQTGGAARVAIISTGDELARPGVDLRPGEIYDSNATLLEAVARRCRTHVVTVEHCADDFAATRAAIAAAIETSNALIISGGVSVGDRDFVKPALRDLKADIDVWRVAIKPGKPFLFGRAGHCLVFGVPGNPVSAFVTFLQFVRPALLKLMGATDHELSLPQFLCGLTRDLDNHGDRSHYIRGLLTAGEFTPLGRQESHALFGLSKSNALLRLDANESRRAGETVAVQVWDVV